MGANKGLAVTKVGSVVGCVALCALCGFLGYSAINMMQTQASDSNVYTQIDTLDSYAEALEQYKANYQAHTTSGETVPGLVVNADNYEDAVAVLETNGIDTSLLKQDSDGTYVYIIQDGDTLSKLSGAFGYSVDQIANFNEIRDVNLIYTDSALRIPNE